jgi:ornithine--oxo-acid transaminase
MTYACAQLIILSRLLVLADVNAWNLACKLRDNGLLCKPTHSDTLRFAPPLTITEEQVLESCDIIRKTMESL